MVESHEERHTTTRVVVDDVVCNRCGKSCKDSMDMNYEGLLEATVRGGFASKLGDGVEHRFSLCEDCLIELFKDFKHAPTTEDRLIESLAGAVACES